MTSWPDLLRHGRVQRAGRGNQRALGAPAWHRPGLQEPGALHLPAADPARRAAGTDQHTLNHEASQGLSRFQSRLSPFFRPCSKSGSVSIANTLTNSAQPTTAAAGRTAMDNSRAIKMNSTQNSVSTPGRNANQAPSLRWVRRETTSKSGAVVPTSRHHSGNTHQGPGPNAQVAPGINLTKAQMTLTTGTAKAVSRPIAPTAGQIFCAGDSAKNEHQPNCSFMRHILRYAIHD